MFAKLLPIICTVLVLSFNIRASVPSPKASVDLICHTNHATECYPKTFQPNEDFQIVHDDQELPPGLHVRLDLVTGKKEAKLNVVEDDDQALMASALDVAIIDSPADSSTPFPELPAVQNRAQKGMKPSDPGTIRPPISNSGEDTSFDTSRTHLKTVPLNKTGVLLSALETLEELSHDIYWGLKLAEDSEVILKLFRLFNSNDSNADVKGAAALVFGTAIQNNPAAFTAALSHFYNDEVPTGPMEAVIVALVHEQLPQLLIRFVYLLSELCQDQAYLWKFINNDGLNILMTVFNAEKAGPNEQRDRLRGKISNFILDYFLQQESFLGVVSQLGSSKRTNGEEFDSGLKHEDPWVLMSGVEGIYEWPHQAPLPPTYKNMAEALKPWCTAFSSSLNIWSEFDSRTGPVEAAEQVQEAHAALEKKLKDLGCSCKMDCDSSLVLHEEL